MTFRVKTAATRYDAIVYAGWCVCGKVAKAKWFFEKAENWKDKRLVIVSVGAALNGSKEAEMALNKILTDEQKTYIEAFYCQGGINYENEPGIKAYHEGICRQP